MRVWEEVRYGGLRLHRSQRDRGLWGTEAVCDLIPLPLTQVEEPVYCLPMEAIA